MPGRPRTGFALSQARADAVRAWLVDDGLAASRLTSSGVGDTQPLGEDIDPATGRLDEGAAAQERRVIVLVRGADC